MNTHYANKAIVGGEKVERYAIGPIPAFAFHTIRYVTIAEMEALIKAGTASEDNFQKHPVDETIRVYGEWLSDTFEVRLLLNEDQLFNIPDEDLDQWEADEWVIMPWDEQWVVKE